MLFKSEKADWVIVGLGNPGSEYEDTRHNAGFKVVDALADELGARYWKTECGCLTAKVKRRVAAGAGGSAAGAAGAGSAVGGAAAHGAVAAEQLIVLAKPQSFMNLSGGPVKKLCAQYGVKPDHLIVVHDELDIPAGDVRTKFGGGHAGHNGLRSICDALGTRDWHRVRTGIGRPPGRMNPADFVLSVPKADAADTFAAAVEDAARAVLSLIG